MRKYTPIAFLIIGFLAGVTFPGFVSATQQNLQTTFFHQLRIPHSSNLVVANSIVIESPSPPLKTSTSPTPAIPPSPTPSPSPKPSPKVVADVKKQFIMGAINNYRRQNGLGNVSTNSPTCSFAKVRAAEIVTSFNHDGFRDRINSKTLPYTSYSEVTENIAHNSDYTQVAKNWIASPPHAENMRKDTPYVCVEQMGEYFVYEGWKP